MRRKPRNANRGVSALKTAAPMRCRCYWELTDGLRLMSSRKFSGAFLLLVFSASHLSRVHVMWTFSGGASNTSSSSSEYKLPMRTKECLSFTSWACGCSVKNPSQNDIIRMSIYHKCVLELNRFCLFQQHSNIGQARRKKNNDRKAHLSLPFCTGEPHLPQHLGPLLHHQCSLVGVR